MTFTIDSYPKVGGVGGWDRVTEERAGAKGETMRDSVGWAMSMVISFVSCAEDSLGNVVRWW